MKKINKLKKILNQRLGIIFCLIAGGGLRFYRLDATSLWKDELFSLIRATRPLKTILFEEIPFGMRTPLHHIVIHLATLFSRSEFMVRLPSVLLGVFTIFLIYELGKLVSKNQRVALVVAFLLAISPLHLEYSREARYYSYLIFLSALSILFFLKLILEKRWQKRWWWLILFSLLMVFNIATHPTALLLMGAIMAFIACLGFVKMISFMRTIKLSIGKKQLFKKIKKIKIKNLRKKRNLLLLGGLIILIWLISFFIKSFEQIFALVKVKPSGSPEDFVITVLKDLSGSFSSLIFYLFSFLIGGWFCLRENRKLGFFLFLLLVFPSLVLYFLRPQGWEFHIRYVSFIVVPYLLFVGCGIIGLLRRNSFVFLAVLLFALLSVEPIGAYYQTKRGDWRGVGEYLKTSSEPGDIVVFETDVNRTLVGYYCDLKEKNIVFTTVADSLSGKIKALPFRRFFHQHDYVSPGGLANPEGIALVDFEEIVSFDPDAEISPMYLFVSRAIWMWQEAEDGFLTDGGWGVSESWGKVTVAADNLKHPRAEISYEIGVPKSGNYDLYVNLRWDGARGLLKHKVDDQEWSAGFHPFFGERGDVVTTWRWKEVKLGTYYLETGEHKISFLNQEKTDSVDRFQGIDYFYLSLNK